ncbi:MAG TPA: hypothetical protein V6D06_02460 [Trichocoleus sp.]
MTQAPEPMIKLEPGGVAPILSYNVPEAIAHSGRNFIDLQIPDSYFVKPKPTNKLVQAQAAAVPVFAALGAPAIKDEALTPEQVKATIARAIATTKLPPSDALQQLDPQEVIAMAEVGQELKLYRSLYGTLHYTYVEAQPQVAAAGRSPQPAMAAMRAPAQRQPDPDENDPNDPGPQSQVTLTITQPTANTTLSGPDTGATFTISGKVSAKRIGGGFAGIEAVEVQVAAVPPFRPLVFPPTAAAARGLTQPKPPRRGRW